MPHIFDLHPWFATLLSRSANPPIQPRILVQGRAKLKTGEAANGQPIFGTTYHNVTFEVTSRIAAPINLSNSRPIYPTGQLGDNLTATEVQVVLTNPRREMAVTQGGAIIDPDSITDMKMYVNARIGDIDALYLSYVLYRGAVVGRPLEEFHKSTFTIRDVSWSAIRQQVVFERFGVKQRTVYTPGVGLSNSPYWWSPGVPAGREVKWWDAIAVFTENGQLRTSVSNSKPDDISIREITTKNGALLGKYALEFVSNTQFRVTYPDNQVFGGDISTDFISPYVDIPAAAWVATGNPLGAKIDWNAYYTVSGNPVTIIMNLIEKALLEGLTVGSVPSFFPSLFVDYANFLALEQRYKHHTVYVSETNPDNKVFTGDGKPFNWMTLAQKVADHINCSLVVTQSGELTISSPRTSAATVQTISDSDWITSAQIEAVEVGNYFVIKYGQNPVSKAYGGQITIDRRTSTSEAIVKTEIYLPYYKVEVSDSVMESMADEWLQRILDGYTRLTVKVTPAFGIGAAVNDIYNVNIVTQPSISGLFQVYSVDKFIGGECTLKLVKYTSLAASSLCNFDICTSTLCAGGSGTGGGGGGSTI